MKTLFSLMIYFFFTGPHVFLNIVFTGPDMKKKKSMFPTQKNLKKKKNV